MIEMIVDSVRVNLVNPNRVVVLKEPDRNRYLAIMIGGSEADSIAIRLQERETLRPLTHDLLLNAIETLGGTIEQITVYKLIDQVYYAKIVIVTQDNKFEIDSRPSDSIALAVRVGAPIFVAEEVLEAAGIEPREDNFDEELEVDAITEDEIKPFADFIKGLDLDDLGRAQ
mgnify:CR=1 FL=1|tara:strand:+ start:190 stop:702 length:513 start_codon:yes stop_codon:yes gene_type:complete